MSKENLIDIVRYLGGVFILLGFLGGIYLSVMVTAITFTNFGD